MIVVALVALFNVCARYTCVELKADDQTKGIDIDPEQHYEESSDGTVEFIVGREVLYIVSETLRRGDD